MYSANRQPHINKEQKQELSRILIDYAEGWMGELHSGYIWSEFSSET